MAPTSRRVVHLQLDQPADADVGDALEAQRGQRALHGLALGVEDALLRADQDATTFTRERSSHAWNGSSVIRS